MEDLFQRVEQNHLNRLEYSFDKRVFYSKTNLFYEKHIPHVGYFLLDGTIALGKKNRVIRYIGGKHLLGVKNLYQKIPVKFFASIMPNSTVLIIDRTTLFGMVDKEPFLYQLLAN